MNNYDFSTLNDKDFEQICKDLLNAKFNLSLQNFKVGKDQGIDLRYSTINNKNSIIVQAKHYLRSGFTQLKNKLQNDELRKIVLLKPDRYILTTSLSLSAREKDELKDILAPWVITPNDIIGQEDLNGYLNEFKEIETNYFKLWFSSVAVLNTILNNAVEGRSKYLLERIQKNISVYVVTKKLDEAIKILNKEKLLLITGQPGIGKTTLAEIIIVSRAKAGIKIYKIENIKEAEDVISREDQEKQLFFFDDFLGSNYLEIINAQKTETQLTSFVERVKNTPNKYLLLTTRTVILNQAVERYERISQSRIAHKQFELRLTDYNNYEKALILYNHLYFRNIKEEFFNCIIKDKFYRTIINHRNYTPRIIDFITNKAIIKDFSVSEYKQYIVNNLNNPKEIWRYSINNQINYLDRCLLLTLFTFQGDVIESHLWEAFEKRLDYEVKEHNQIINANQFLDSIRILLNGFLTSELDTSINSRIYDFINPSLNDYFIGYLSESYDERKNVITSILFYEQLVKFNPEKSLIPLESNLQIIIRDKIGNNQLRILNPHISKSPNRINSLILENLSRYCSNINIDSLLLKHFELIDFSINIGNIVEKLLYVLLKIKDSPMTYQFLQTNFYIILERIMKYITDPEDVNKIPEIFLKYNQNYDEYNESDDGFNNLLNVIENTLKSQEDAMIDDKASSITCEDDLYEMYSELEDIETDLKSNLFPNQSFDYDFGIGPDLDEWSQKMIENAERIEEESRNAEIQQDFYKEREFEPFNEDKIIDDLFTR